MQPIRFSEQNTKHPEDHPDFLPFPALRESGGQVITCWKPSISERLKLLFTGRLWLTQQTFGQGFNPQLPQIESPFKDKVD